jgi:hypothetical protein
MSFTFDEGVTSGLIAVTFRAPSGTTSSVAIPVDTGSRTTFCPP